MLSKNRKYFSKILLVVYIFLIGVSSLHQHNFHNGKYAGIVITEEQNYNDPFLDELGKCKIAQFINSSFQIDEEKTNLSFDFPVIEILVSEQFNISLVSHTSQISPRAPPAFS